VRKEQAENGLSRCAEERGTDGAGFSSCHRPHYGYYRTHVGFDQSIAPSRQRVFDSRRMPCVTSGGSDSNLRLIPQAAPGRYPSVRDP
jgi:hypothetical protein